MPNYILFFIIAVICSACSQQSELIKPSGDWYFINATKELPRGQK